MRDGEVKTEFFLFLSPSQRSSSTPAPTTCSALTSHFLQQRYSGVQVIGNVPAERLLICNTVTPSPTAPPLLQLAASDDIMTGAGPSRGMAWRAGQRRAMIAVVIFLLAGPLLCA